LSKSASVLGVMDSTEKIDLNSYRRGKLVYSSSDPGARSKSGSNQRKDPLYEHKSGIDPPTQPDHGPTTNQHTTKNFHRRGAGSADPSWLPGQSPGSERNSRRFHGQKAAHR